MRLRATAEQATVLVTIHEAAARLQVSQQTLRRWDRQGVLRPQRHPINGFRLYDADQIERLRSDRLDAPGPERAETNLWEVAPLDSFVGRRAELAAIEEQVARGARILTIHGPPGVGKTRLALEVAGQLGSADRSTPRRSWFFHLADAWDVRDVCGVIARSIGERVVPDRDPMALVRSVASALKRKGRALFLLDDFEHLVEPAATIVPTLARRAVDAVFLVTSRERLRVEGEVVVELGPLGTPLSDDPRAVMDSEAGRLFLQRARGPVAIDDRSAATVAAIVRELEGIPLAIELAAARTDVLDPEALRRRLEDRSAVLAPAPRGVAARRASLRGAIDCSWELLTQAERAALAQCSVFRGGFTLEAAEQVVDLAAFTGPPTVLDVVGSLRDKSLLRRAIARGPGDPSRLEMLLAVRDYAAEQLEKGGATEAAQRRHARYFLQAGRRWFDAWERGDEIAATDAIALEQENLTSIHARVTPTSERSIEEAIEALELLWPVSSAGGGSERFVEVASRLVDLCEQPTVPTVLSARALHCRSDLHSVQGEHGRVLADVDRALGRIGEDRTLEAKLRLQRANSLLGTGQLDEGLLEAQRTLALWRAIGRTREIAISLVVVAKAQVYTSRLAEAEEAVQEAIPMLEELGRIAWRGFACVVLGFVQLERGSLDDAKATFGRAAELYRERRSPFAGSALHYAATACHERGALSEARDLYLEALEVFGGRRGFLTGVGAHFQRCASMTRSRLGALLASLGRPLEAESELRAAHRIAKGFGSCLVHLGLDSGHLDLAAAVSAWIAGDVRASEEAAARARQRLETGRAWLVQQPLGWGTVSVRSSRRILKRAIDGLEAVFAANGRSCVVSVDGTWFWQPGPAGRAEIGGQRAHARILAALAEARLRSPGTVVSHAALVAAGWPDVELSDRTGRHRVHTAISALRSLGLTGVVESTPDGYLIPATIPVFLQA